MFKIVVTIGQLEVRMETDKAYPDICDDLTNRTVMMLKSAVSETRSAGWCPLDVEIEEEESDTPTIE